MAEISDAGTGTIEDLVDIARAESEKESAPDTPPATKKRTTRKRNTRTKRNLTEPLTELYSTLGAGVFLLSPPDGALLLEHGANCANALNGLAQENPNVYAALDKLCTGGAMGAVLIAHAPIVLGIMTNHNLVPDLSIFGRKPTDDDKDSQDSAATTNGRSSYGGQRSENPGGNGSAAVVGPLPRVSPIIVETG